MSEPVKLNQIEECEWCGERADFKYRISNNDGLSFFCKTCIKAAEELNKNILKEKIEEKAARDERDKIYNLIEETGDAIESLLLNNNIVYNKIKSLMSASVYFEFEVGGVDKKIRISDHDARHTYNILNGYSNFNIAVGYESGECNFSLFESEEIEEVTSILNEIYFNK